MGRRLIALGIKESSYSTLSVRYSLFDEEWNPQIPASLIEDFDLDARTKEQEEAYGPDDVR